MHHARYMVGEVRAAYDAALWKRYFRRSKHSKPGTLKTTFVGLVLAFGVVYG